MSDRQTFLCIVTDLDGSNPRTWRDLPKVSDYIKRARRLGRCKIEVFVRSKERPHNTAAKILTRTFEEQGQ